MLGKWTLANGKQAEVTDKSMGFWIGVVIIGETRVPSYWNRDGNSPDPGFNLKERKREYIQF